MLMAPVRLIDGVAETVAEIAHDHTLALITKGDLLDQETKLARSGLGDHFAHLEVVSRKDRGTYERILDAHGVPPAAFVMVGNSIRSDILPVLETGAAAVHIPYPETWAHEEVPAHAVRERSFLTIEDFRELPRVLREM